MGQLPLNLRPREGLGFDHFVAGESLPALAALHGAASSGEPPLVYLHGRPGCGKTHVLTAACALATGQGRGAAMLALGDRASLDPGDLQALPGLALVAFDDVDAITGDDAWEQAVFHAFNQVREAGGGMLFTAQVPPSGLAFHLPDLTSRLSWGQAHRLRRLGPGQLDTAVDLHARRLGLELPAGVRRFLKTRFARDIASIVALLEKLEFESMAEQRRITVPFVRGLLKPNA